MAEFRMPSLGADMEAGTLTEWLVKPGDAVKRGDIVAVVETQKGAIEIEIFESGTIDELLVEPGTEVPVGTALATVGTGAEAAPPGPAEAAPPSAHEPTEAPAAPAPKPPASTLEPPPMHTSPAARRLAAEAGLDPAELKGTGPHGEVLREDVEAAIAARRGGPPAGGRVKASPAARRLAAEHGVDLAAVTPSGPEGAVVRADVAATAPEAAPRARPAPRGFDTASMRQAVAAAMARSKREIPHYYLATAIDMKAAMDWLIAENSQRPVTGRLLPAALLIKATALALREVPELNGFWRDGAFVPGDGVHPGVAVALKGGGLINPAIRDADTMSLDALMPALLDLVKRARKGGLRGSELSSATATITNLGDLGVETVFGVITPPQVAVIGFGRIVERPWAVDGMLGVRPVVQATLSADHRASDGQHGGRLLSAIDRMLQEPETLR